MDTKNKNESSFDKKNLEKISSIIKRIKEINGELRSLKELVGDSIKENKKKEYIHTECFNASSYRKCIDCGIRWVSKTKYEFFPPNFSMCIYSDGTDNLVEYCRECQVKHSRDE